MPTDIIMPQLGESIAEGTIVRWLIAPGGRIEPDHGDRRRRPRHQKRRHGLSRQEGARERRGDPAVDADAQDIAERMVNSRRTAAHVVTFFEADFAAIAKFRQGRGLTYLPFVI